MHDPPTSPPGPSSTPLGHQNVNAASQTKQIPYDDKAKSLEKLKEAYNERMRAQAIRSQLGTQKKSKLNQAETVSGSPSPTLENGVRSPSGGSAGAVSSVGKSTFKKPYPVSGKPRFEVREGQSTGSYFPQMPIRSSSFNAMSPLGVGPQDKPLPSGSATPSSFAFAPPGSSSTTPFENPEFPTPNMYELALHLHSEPGIDAFWNNLVKIATTVYKAERVSLAVPTDSTDLENTPWGQKATYHREDSDGFSLTYIGESGVGDLEMEETEEEEDGHGVAIPAGLFSPCQRDFNTRERMNEEIKGYSSGDEVSLPCDSSPGQPFSPIVIGMSDTEEKDRTSNSDWISEASNMSGPASPRSSHGGQTEREETFEHIRILPGIDDDRPRGRVFPTLQPLSYEADALLDGAGVIRVLQRGKAVVLSREYRDIQSHLENKSAVEREKRHMDMRWSSNVAASDDCNEKVMREKLHISLKDIPPATPNRTPSEPPTPLCFVGKNVRRKGKKSIRKNDLVSNPALQFFSSHQHQQHHSQSHCPSQALYEEYEQPLSSPWSQSPAPSPAIKPDPSENPFFAPPKVDEETFNPTESSPIYSAQEPVHAIGLENASTVIHIPLVHPSISTLTQSNLPQTSNIEGSKERRFSQKGSVNASSTKGFTNSFLNSLGSATSSERRAPIAILSILSPVIPYPPNLVHSLSHFAPLVATAFALAQAHEHLQSQLSHYRTRSRRRQIPFSVQSTLLSPGFRSLSTTSPSDQSTISRYSPASLADSPNAESGGGYVFQLKSSSLAHSPETRLCGNADSYFTAKRLDSSRNHNRLQMSESDTAQDLQLNNLMCNGEPDAKSKSAFVQEEDFGVYSGETIRNGELENSEILVKEDATGTFPNDVKQPIGVDDSFRQSEQTMTSLLDIESTPGRSENTATSQPDKAASARKRRSLRKPSHAGLHSYGADHNTKFTSGTVRFRSGLTSPRSFAIREMPPPSNKLLRTIIDSIPVHVFTAAPYTGVPVWANTRLLTYQGVSAKEFLKSPWSAIHPDDRDEYRKLWKKAVDNGLPFSHQMRIRRFDGEYRWFMNRAVPLRDSKMGIVHWFGTNMDVHDQRIAEVNAARQAEIAESEHKYRSLANSSPQIVFAATADDGITFANTQWEAYSGQTLQQTLHLGFMEFVHPLDRFKCFIPPPGGISNVPPLKSPKSQIKSPGEKLKSEFRRTNISEGVPDTSSEKTFSTELRLKRKDGEYRWHLVRCLRVESNFGTGEGQWFGTCTDINDHKLLEQRLKEANEAAQKTMESKTRFLANMSHEIRTPLIGISGMVNFLLDTPLNGEQLDYCHTISQSSDGLLTVINDILDLSKVEAGMMRLNSTWFRIHSLIEDANELLSTMAIQKHLELNYIVEEDVPAVVGGDRIRLRQVLLNVIGNAIKFTNTGEVFSRCSVIKDAKVGDDEIMLQFECHDTGPGFDKKEEELIFKPFSQIDGSSTRAHGGSGLGLVISRQLVELHVGKMTASSVKGQGSTFVFSAVFKLYPERETAESGSSISLENAENDAILDKGFTEASRSPSVVGYTDAGIEATDHSSEATDPSLTHADDSLVQTLIASESPDPATMRFSLPVEVKQRFSSYLNPGVGAAETPNSISKRSSVDSGLGRTLTPPVFSILIISEHRYSRIAIAHHIKMTLPKAIPNQITTASSFSECMETLVREDPAVFTHLVINLPDHAQIIALLGQVLNSRIHSATTILVLTNPMQRTAIIEGAPRECKKLDNKLQFIYKPIKPSRFGVIFDPDNERDASTDRNRDSAQQVVESQKRVFSEMEKDVGNKGHRVLLVEDNLVNQKVLLRFLSRVGLEVETASDGEECVSKVFSHGSGYYALILCDLHMPRKDGFQACAEIRQWEKGRKYLPVPIIALSADVVSGVAGRCAAAGFSRYVSKPVNFEALSNAIKELLDPTKSHDLMSPQSPTLLTQSPMA